MRRAWLHITVLLILALSCRGPRLIPRDDMVDIMVDMLIRDQQLKQGPHILEKDDTTLVYEGIFQARGYDTDDFRHSVEYYLEDASRMEKILGDVSEVLSAMSKEAGRQIELKRWTEKMMRIYAQKPDTTQPQPRLRAIDSLKVQFENDSVKYVVPKDSLEAYYRDSLLFVRDSL